MASNSLVDEVRATRPGATLGVVTPAAAARRIDRALGRRIASIQVKLVLAFMLVSLVPMLVAAHLTARVVTGVFDQNIEAWLTETSSFLLNEIVISQREANGLARFVVDHTSMEAQLATGSGELPPTVSALLDALGYDLVTVYSPERGILYASQPIRGLQPLPLAGDGQLYRVELADRAAVMVSGAARFMVGGTPYFLVVGNWLDDKFVSSLAAMRSLEARIFYRQGGDYVEIYSAQPSGAPAGGAARSLPAAIRARLEAGPPIHYDRHALDGAYRGIYRAVPGGDREPVAVIFCGLRADRAGPGWLTEMNLSIIILAVGLFLSVAAGSLLSRRLTRPLRSLATGVQAIAAGDYAQRVEAQGRDEVADLARAFNRMAVRLEDLHRLEAQLRRRDRLSALGEVAVGIAHEVRNPLGVISTSAELVRKKAENPSDAKLLGYVIDEVRRINLLITEFLAFARPTPPVLAPMKVIDVVQRVAGFCDPELTRQKIALAIRDEAPGAMINGDQDQLYQACLNLVLNAIDAMPDGGRLAIRLWNAGDQVRVAFADSGTGVPPDLQERVFNPFFTTKPNGTGLGLAKSFSILESHGGRIECDSPPGGGATFTLVLPRLPRDT